MRNGLEADWGRKRRKNVDEGHTSLWHPMTLDLKNFAGEKKKITLWS